MRARFLERRIRETIPRAAGKYSKYGIAEGYALVPTVGRVVDAVIFPRRNRDPIGIQGVRF